MSLHVHTHVLETTNWIPNQSSGTDNDLTICYSCFLWKRYSRIGKQRCDQTEVNYLPPVVLLVCHCKVICVMQSRWLINNN